MPRGTMVLGPLKSSEVDRVLTAYLKFSSIKDSHGQLWGCVGGVLATIPEAD